MISKLFDGNHRCLREVGTAWDTLALPVVASSGVSDLLDRAVVEGEGWVVDVHFGLLELLGSCGRVVGWAVNMHVGFSWNLDMDVGLGIDVLVLVSESVG